MIDYIDLQIIDILYNLKDNENLRTWGIMKKIYPKGKDIEHNRVMSKVDKLSRYGIILITNDTEKVYRLVKDYIHYSRHKFPDGKYYNSVGLFLKGKWCIFQR